MVSMNAKTYADVARGWDSLDDLFSYISHHLERLAKAIWVLFSAKLVLLALQEGK